MSVITLIYGKNTFLAQQYVEECIASFIEEGGSRSEVSKVHVEPETNVEDVLLTMQNVSLFSSKKLTILYDVTKHPAFVEKIEQFCASADEHNWLVIVDSTLQSRSKVVTAIDKLPNSTVLKAEQKNEGNLQSWAVQYVKSLRPDATLSPANARHLVELLGEDQMLVAKEIEKLVSGLSDGGEITKEYIDALVEKTPQSSVFAMLDAMLASEPDKAMAIYEEQLSQGTAPQQILGTIVWQLSQLAYVVDSKQRSNKDVTSVYGVSSYVISKLRSLAEILTMKDVAVIVAEVMEADYQSRTNASTDDAIEYIVSFISVYLQDKKTVTR